MSSNDPKKTVTVLVRAGLVGGVVLLIDQGSKFLAPAVLLNTGISGSILADAPDQLVLVGVGVVLAGIGWLNRNWWLAHPVISGLFFGGAVSNFLDRVALGGVRDWLPIPLIGWTNNLADYAISAAVLALLWGELKRMHQHKSSVETHD